MSKALYYGAASLSLLLLAAHCESGKPEPEPPEPPKPMPTIEPAPEPVEEASCATACENQRHLKCEVGQPTAEGSTCEQVCEVSFNAGVPGLEWDVNKMTNTEACED